MKKLRPFWLIFLVALLCVSTTLAFHAPPWDTGHNSFVGDPGDDDSDPGDDGPCKSGSPVELANGNFVYNVRDLLIVGLGPAIDLTRTYNSRDMHKGPFGNGWAFPYDQRLIETTDGTQVFAICTQPNGKREVFTKKADGSYQSPPHVRTTLVKNSDNTHTLRENTGIVRRFNADGRLVSLVDRNSNTLTLAYDPTGFPTSITDASGRVIQFTKGADGRIERVTDSANRTFRYTYDSAGNLTRFTDPLGNATNYQYDAKSNLTAILDPRGNKLIGLTYDAKGRVATLLEGAETWTYSYLTGPIRTTKRDSSNNTWTYFYNTTGNLTKLTDPLGNSENYIYDANLNLTEFTDKNGNKTIFTYDANGNPLTVKDAVGNSKTFTYGSNFDRPLSLRDRAGNLTTNEYDARGNLTKTTNALGQVTGFQYDLKGQLVSITDAAGKTSSFSYDAQGNLVKTTDPVGNTNSATFDTLGQVLTKTDASGRVSQYVYDANQRLIRTVNPQGGTVINEYDAADNLQAITLQNGARTTFEYDLLNRLTKTTNPLGQITSLTYDKRNNLTSKTDPKGQQAQYSYDVLDRLTRKTRPGDTVNYSYDRVGNLLSVTDSDSNLTFVHDSLNRISEVRTGSSSQPTTTIQYEYDVNGNRRRMTDPSGGVTNYSYDALSRLSSLTDPSSQTFAFTFDSLSLRKEMTRPGGTTSYTYDAASRLSSILHQSSAGDLAFSYSYDQVGNRLNLNDSAGTHSYGYDSLNRLVGATHPGAVESYVYDSMGNRTSSHLSASHSHNTVNRLTADARFDYTYDANGNLTRKTERATAQQTNYTFDSENQLSQINFSNGTSAAYRYDGLGRRIEKNVGGQITRYVYDGQDILLEYAGTTVQARYTHGPGVDEVLSVQRGGSSSLFETDALGSTARVVNGGAVRAAYSYDSFGRIVNQTGVSQAPYLFQGREFDQESGLYYFRARYYDPVIGRFISEDPIGFAGGLNFYRFGLNNPVNLIDPFGLRPCVDDWLDGLQTLFDIVGLIPGFGEFFDLANAGIYGLRGDELNAGLSLAGAIPFIGWGGTAGKFANKASKYVDITKGGSVANRATDVTRSQFERNLTDAGWNRSISKDGKVSIFEKDGSKYVVRDGAKSTGKPTADFYKAGSRGKPDVKIRLDQP